MAFSKLRCIIESTALVMPQPKQSIPKIFLMRQIVCCLLSQSKGIKYRKMGKNKIIISNNLLYAIL
jgi:hypothetical protein